MEKVKITFLMLAFNSKRFIKDAIDSVLNQSEKNIRLVIRNNASTDDTGDICRAYVKRDSRVTYLENKVPNITEEGISMRQREWWPEINSEYIAYIDHDDILDREFARKMYAAAEQFEADIVVCGNYFFEDATKQIFGERFAPVLHTTDISCVAKRISEYYKVFRTLWAKIYKADFHDKYYKEALNAPDKLQISGDTYSVFAFLEQCHSFVCIEDILYYYRVNSNSQFYSKTPELYRIDAADVLYEKAFEFLCESGALDKRNIVFLYSVHWGHMMDLINIVKKSDSMQVDEKLRFVQEILKNNLLRRYAENSIDILLETIFDFIKEILNKSEEDAGILQNFYIYRLYYVMRKARDSNDAFLYCTMISAVIDPENIYHIGVSLLGKRWGTISAGEQYFMKADIERKLLCFNDLTTLRNMLSWPISSEDYREEEDELVKAAEQENWELAAEIVSRFNDTYPFNEYAAYYRLYLACLLHEWEFAKKQAYVTRVLWSDSPEIVELCQYILKI